MLGHICRYPDCRTVATASWRLVPVCDEHREAVRAETVRYYAGKLPASMRVYDKALRLAKESERG